MGACVAVVALLLGACSSAHGQFDLEDSHTTASLRGIDALGAGVAWASGSSGTVLRTEDGGYLWQTCAMPKGAEKLDFRGVQGFDAMTAVVMSSGPGALSKIYKTTDGCQSWKLVFDNPDATGFFDAVRKVTERKMYLLGDPVHEKFAMFYSPDKGDHWYPTNDRGREAAKDAGAFAASNSSFVAAGDLMMFGTGATSSEAARVYRTRNKCDESADNKGSAPCSLEWVGSAIPMGSGATTVGVYSVGARRSTEMSGKTKVCVVAVGGDYEKPQQTLHTAAFSTDGGAHWTAAKTMPGGYRSGVAYDAPSGRWISVGPTGVDESRDDGLNWMKLTASEKQPSSTDEGWNAISPPYVVGSSGRIGKLRAEAGGR